MPQTPQHPAPEVVELRATYIQGQQLLQNVFHVRHFGEWEEIDLEELIDLYIDWETTTGREERSTSVSLIEVRATDLTSIDSRYKSSALIVPIAGNRAVQALPENVTWAVQLNTGVRGRGRQGRIFWIGLTEDQSNGSTMTVPGAAAIVAALNTLKNAIGAVGSQQMVVLHSVRNSVKLNPRTYSLIDSISSSDLTTDSQKNRLPNHKRKKRPTT